MLVGPTARYVAEKTDYESDRLPLEEFWQSALTLLPELKLEDLRLAYSGLRPKLVPPSGHGIADFVIARDPGCARAIHLVGIESPGTDCRAGDCGARRGDGGRDAGLNRFGTACGERFASPIGGLLLRSGTRPPSEDRAPSSTTGSSREGCFAGGGGGAAAASASASTSGVASTTCTVGTTPSTMMALPAGV